MLYEYDINIYISKQKCIRIIKLHQQNVSNKRQLQTQNAVYYRSEENL
jgi:hypothetical protein